MTAIFVKFIYGGRITKRKGFNPNVQHNKDFSAFTSRNISAIVDMFQEVEHDLALAFDVIFFPKPNYTKKSSIMRTN